MCERDGLIKAANFDSFLCRGTKQRKKSCAISVIMFRLYKYVYGVTVQSSTLFVYKLHLQFTPTLTNITSHRHIIMTHLDQEFHGVKTPQRYGI